MTTPEDTSERETPVPGEPRGRAVPMTELGASGWSAFHEREVMLQLREPYLVITYSYNVDMTDEGAKALPFLSGKLFVEPNGAGGVLLVLRRQLSESDYLVVAVNPGDVLYCTHIHRSTIITT